MLYASLILSNVHFYKEDFLNILTAKTEFQRKRQCHIGLIVLQTVAYLKFKSSPKLWLIGWRVSLIHLHQISHTVFRRSVTTRLKYSRVTLMFSPTSSASVIAFFIFSHTKIKNKWQLNYRHLFKSIFLFTVLPQLLT